MPTLAPMSTRATVLLSVLAAVGAAALGTYCLSTVLVLGGRTGQWLEAHGWVYPAVLATGCAVLAAGLAVPLWPLAPLGAALVLIAAARYLWLNV